MPRNLEALERLATLHAQGRNWAGAVDCLQGLLELELAAAARARHTLELARIHDEGLGDAAARHRALPQGAGADARATRRWWSGWWPLRARRATCRSWRRCWRRRPAHDGRWTRSAPVALRMRVADLYARPLDEPARAIAAVPAGGGRRTRTNLAGARGAGGAVHARPRGRRRWPSRSTGSSCGWTRRGWTACTRSSSCGRACKQHDKAFCAAAVLQFLRAANEVEMAFYNEARRRLAQEAQRAAEPRRTWTRC